MQKNWIMWVWCTVVSCMFRVASNVLVRVICKLVLPFGSIAESLLGSMNTY